MGMFEKIIRSRIFQLIYELYSMEGWSAGGGFHIVLDDFNVRDKDILFCIEYTLKNDYSEESKKIACQLAGLLLFLPEEDRLKLLTYSAMPKGGCKC